MGTPHLIPLFSCRPFRRPLLPPPPLPPPPPPPPLLPPWPHLIAQAVPEAERLDTYRLYIKKAEAFYGVTRTREIHEAAIAALPDKDAQAMALEYAALERKLGEVRARRRRQT